MKPKLEEERRKVVEAAREEALENAIALVKQKVREQLELEQQAKEDVVTSDAGGDTTRETEGEAEGDVFSLVLHN